MNGKERLEKDILAAVDDLMHCDAQSTKELGLRHDFVWEGCSPKAGCPETAATVIEAAVRRGIAIGRKATAKEAEFLFDVIAGVPAGGSRTQTAGASSSVRNGRRVVRDRRLRD